MVTGMSRDGSTQRLPHMVMKVDGGSEAGSAGVKDVEGKDGIYFFFEESHCTYI